MIPYSDNPYNDLMYVPGVGLVDDEEAIIERMERNG